MAVFFINMRDEEGKKLSPQRSDSYITQKLFA